MLLFLLALAAPSDTCNFDLPLTIYHNPDAPSMAAPLMAREAVDSLGVYVGWLFLAPGQMVPEHDHGDDEEMLMVVCGGALFRRGGSEVALVPGSSIRIPKRTRHAAIAGSDGMVAVQVYRGGAPGLRFYGWDHAKPPPPEQ